MGRIGEYGKERGGGATVRGLTGELMVVGAMLLVGLLLRTYRLDQIPPGVHYDEAANGLLAAGIAEGGLQPLFIPAYTGKETLFFYLAAAVMRALGPSLYSLRLTSAVVGTLTLVVTYWLATVLFVEEGRARAEQLALGGSVLMAISFWHVVLSRYGFRAVSQPLLQGLTLGFLWKGLREDRLALIAVSGGLCGATLYTYLAGRAFPLVFVPLFALLLASGQRARSRSGVQILVFSAVVALVFMPLGIYFLRHPGTFWVRIEQLSPAAGGNTDLAVVRRLWEGFWRQGGLLVSDGDRYYRFNLPGRPVLSWPIAVLFVLGVGRSVWLAFRSKDRLGKGMHLTMLTWLGTMAMPSLLASPGPSNLRSVGLLPVLFLSAAQGLVVVIGLLGWIVSRMGVGWGEARHRAIWLAVVGLMLGWGGIRVFRDYFYDWGISPLLHYQTEADLRAAARYLDGIDPDEFSIYVSSEHYRHPSLSFLSSAYPRIKWLVGDRVMVLPAEGSRPAMYVFPHSAQPQRYFVEHYFPRDRLVHQDEGPEGQVDLMVYVLGPGMEVPGTVPVGEGFADFGGVIELTGWEVSGPVVAGERVELTLWWRVLGIPMVGDYVVFVHFLDESGKRWAQADFFSYPSEQWEPGEMIINRPDVRRAELAPPGEYYLEVGLYSRSTGDRLRREGGGEGISGSSVTLGPIRVWPPRGG